MFWVGEFFFYFPGKVTILISLFWGLSFLLYVLYTTWPNKFVENLHTVRRYHQIRLVGTELTINQGTELTINQGTELTINQGTELTINQGTELTINQGTSV
jgi:hypothetical protein